jgi:membrane protein implicated in regulation of membrane protease activity
VSVSSEEVLVLWIVLVLLLALAGGFLGTLLEFALWVVVLMVLGFALLGLVIWRAVSSRTGSATHVGRR